jgi:transposase
MVSAMKYVNPLLEPMIITLKEMYKNAPVHRMRQRAHIILMSNKGLTLEEIGLVTDLDRDTISATIDVWEKQGLGGLYDGARIGRPPIFNESEQALILSQIEQEPRQLKKVLATIKNITGKSSSTDTIKRIAKRKNLIWKRIKKHVASKPNTEEYQAIKKNLRS